MLTGPLSNWDIGDLTNRFTPKPTPHQPGHLRGLFVAVVQVSLLEVVAQTVSEDEALAAAHVDGLDFLNFAVLFHHSQEL